MTEEKTMPDITPAPETLIRRIEALEMDAAHRGRVIDDLNATLTAQWKEIDALKRQLARLSEQTGGARSATGSPTQEPPPPHY